MPFIDPERVAGFGEMLPEVIIFPGYHMYETIVSNIS